VLGFASGVPDMLGELGLAVWLLVVGTRRLASPGALEALKITTGV